MLFLQQSFAGQMLAATEQTMGQVGAFSIAAYRTNDPNSVAVRLFDAPALPHQPPPHPSTTL